MATATATVKVIPPVPQEPVSEYTLVLSEKEATALVAVLNAVGGPPFKSGRKHITSILGALEELGVKFSFGCFQDDSRSLYWKEGAGL